MNIIAIIINFVLRQFAKKLYRDAFIEIRNIANEKKVDEVLKKRQEQLQKALKEKAEEADK